ncbi:MAG TPA: hypothetical protein VHK91_10915 [Flavisolibacter sp.]|jgi:uncharacterized membrane protein|nr:hypothetical protein [Flavisolibacter sp.]
MKSTYLLYFVAAVLFAIAAVLSLINASYFRAGIGVVGSISFILAGIHYRRQYRNHNRRL